MPKALNNGKITEALQKAFGFKGRYNPMLDEVIVPVYPIVDPVPAAPQLTYAALIVAEPAVSRVARIRFSNPLGSGVDIVITSAQFGALKPQGAAVAITYGAFYPTTSDGPFPGTIYPTFTAQRDRRQQQPPRGILTGQDTVVLGFPSTNFFVATIVKTDDTTAELTNTVEAGTRQPLTVLPPGTDVDVSSIDANAEAVEILMNFTWIEVPIGASGEGGTPG